MEHTLKDADIKISSVAIDIPLSYNTPHTFTYQYDTMLDNILKQTEGQRTKLPAVGGHIFMRRVVYCFHPPPYYDIEDASQSHMLAGFHSDRWTRTYPRYAEILKATLFSQLYENLSLPAIKMPPPSKFIFTVTQRLYGVPMNGTSRT